MLDKYSWAAWTVSLIFWKREKENAGRKEGRTLLSSINLR